MTKTKHKLSAKEQELEALRDKRRNLSVKQANCASPLGVARYARMLHEVDREIAAKGGV